MHTGIRTNDMPAARRVSPRRIVVRDLDIRCAGTYRQSADWATTPSLDDPAMPTGWALECGGRVTTPLSFRYDQLVEMARLDRRLGFGVPLVDVLARVGLQTDAEVLLARDAHGRTFGVPIRDVVVADDEARLTLGTRRSALSPVDGFPVRLDVPGWTDPTDPVVVTSLEAVDFSEFVRCP